MITGRPKIAIVDPNTLAVLGLRQLLQQFMPVMTVETFGTMSEFQANHPEEFVHYFVAMNIVVENRAYFAERRRQTIVLTLSLDGGTMLSEFHCICINVPEQELVRSLMLLVQQGHPHGKNLPPRPQTSQQKILSDREIEVMSLVAQGYINKEIADRLHICLSTVVTHRKNIMEKLSIRSVSALTIYAVMNGYVDINKI
ncbi:MAG: response regulator transcription factor [Prevotella sp.]|nr:response regulator transcription factor [Prevotella sp.]